MAALGFFLIPPMGVRLIARKAQFFYDRRITPAWRSHQRTGFSARHALWFSGGRPAGISLPAGLVAASPREFSFSSHQRDECDRIRDAAATTDAPLPPNHRGLNRSRVPPESCLSAIGPLSQQHSNGRTRRPRLAFGVIIAAIIDKNRKS
jgi:hypothetical protein